MKPDWKDAPEWANWLAMDKCEAWWWEEGKPSYKARFIILEERPSVAEEERVNNSVFDTLKQRP